MDVHILHYCTGNGREVETVKCWFF